MLHAVAGEDDRSVPFLGRTTEANRYLESTVPTHIITIEAFIHYYLQLKNSPAPSQKNDTAAGLPHTRATSSISAIARTAGRE